MDNPAQNRSDEAAAMVTMRIELLDYWHAGSGESGAGDIDLTVVRDCDGLPFIPARTVKGLLRDAVWLAESFGHEASGTTFNLFGKPAVEGLPESSIPGCLRFEDALVSTAFRAWATCGAASGGCRPEASALFEVLAQTAIEEGRGVAKNSSLRVTETVVPITLEAEIRCVSACPYDWQTVLRRCVPLIKSLGKGRHRGLGRCVCTTNKSDR